MTLVTAPTALHSPAGVETRQATTVAEMREAVLDACVGADALVMAAAISDFRPAAVSDRKIKKESGSDGLVLHLVKNDDFFLEVPKGVLRIAFAAESENLLHNAAEKLARKGGGPDRGERHHRAGQRLRHGHQPRDAARSERRRPEALPQLPKEAVAGHILDRVQALLAG